VSVLIPARNEVDRLPAALESVLANREMGMEVIVLDDHSTDGTAELVSRYAARDERVRLASSPPLSPGWCGKQHACHVLAEHARGQWLIFMDADVRLAPDAIHRMVNFLRRSGSALASGVPRQITGSLLERLLVPLIHFVLLGFLPVWRMRRCTKPAYAAGCGQLFVARADAYRQVGGHARIRESLHDGIRLPRAFRESGFRTDLFDATDLAWCRMYVGAREVIEGSMKNAHEALASPAMILPMSVFLLGGQVLPWILLAGTGTLPMHATGYALAAALLGLLPRLFAAWRFRQSAVGAILHPFSVALFVGLQWWAFMRGLRGRPAEWRGRAYASRTTAGCCAVAGGVGIAQRRVEL
jgi:glycosyltransferase involved in cell wall biosynthesis